MPKDSSHQVRVTDSRLVFEGKIWDVSSETFEYGDDSLTREFIDHPGAVAVTATNELGQILLIKQYRHPVRQKLWELPAGLLDVQGESAESAARRELIEETGFAAQSIDPLIEFAPTPGGSSELIRIFHATNLVAVEKPEVHGEERDLEIAWFDLAEAVQSVLAGEIKNSAAIIGILALSQKLSR